MQAQSIVFNNTYNNYSRTFEYLPSKYLYNNDAVSAFTNSNEAYFLSGNSFSNYSITSDTPVLTLFNLKIDLYGDTIWQRTNDLSINGNEGVGYFYEYTNKNLIAFGTIADSLFSYFEFQDGLVYKMDSMGNELWRKRHHFGDDTHMFAPFTKDEGITFQVLGFADVDTAGINYDAFISTIDSSGNLINNIQLGGAFYERIYNSKGLVVKNNHIYIAGVGIDTLTENDTTINTSGGWLLKLDMQGNIIWDEESFIIGAQTQSYFDIDLYPIGWLLKVDTLGTIIWEREITKYKQDGFTIHHYVYDMLVTQDKGILLGGYVIANAVVDINGYFYRNDAWLAKTDSCGFTVGDIPQPMLLIDSVKGKTVYITDQSTNYCTASLDWGDPEWSGQVERYYAYENNQPLAEKHFSHTYSQTGDITIRTRALAGEEFREYEVQVLGLSNNSIGTVIPAQAGISLFPNPANDYVIVQNPYSSNVKASANEAICSNPADCFIVPHRNDALIMSIYNLNGKQVKSINLNPKLYQQKIDISTLNNSVYFVRFELDGELVGTERLVIAK